MLQYWFTTNHLPRASIDAKYKATDIWRDDWEMWEEAWNLANTISFNEGKTYTSQKCPRQHPYILHIPIFYAKQGPETDWQNHKIFPMTR